MKTREQIVKEIAYQEMRLKCVKDETVKLEIKNIINGLRFCINEYQNKESYYPTHITNEEKNYCKNDEQQLEILLLQSQLESKDDLLQFNKIVLTAYKDAYQDLKDRYKDLEKTYNKVKVNSEYGKKVKQEYDVLINTIMYRLIQGEVIKIYYLYNGRHITEIGKLIHVDTDCVYIRDEGGRKSAINIDRILQIYFYI